MKKVLATAILAIAIAVICTVAPPGVTSTEQKSPPSLAKSANIGTAYETSNVNFFDPGRVTNTACVNKISFDIAYFGANVTWIDPGRVLNNTLPSNHALTFGNITAIDTSPPAFTSNYYKNATALKTDFSTTSANLAINTGPPATFGGVDLASIGFDPAPQGIGSNSARTATTDTGQNAGI